MTDPLSRFRGNLLTIADCYALIAAQHHAAATGKPGAARVSGSAEPKLPIAVDQVDLTSVNHPATLYVAGRSPWPEDQIGHLSVASELDFWVTDIAAQLGDPRPLPTAPVLAMWLHERAGWAWDYYGPLDEMVNKVADIARTLWAMTNPDRPARAEHRTADCPACGEATLVGDGERVWCTVEACGRVLTEGEYRTWAAAEAHRTLNGERGISAKAIAIRWNRTAGTVKRWASQYAWPKSSGTERPVLYLRSAVEESVAGILEREARELEAKAA